MMSVSWGVKIIKIIPVEGMLRSNVETDSPKVPLLVLQDWMLEALGNPREGDIITIELRGSSRRTIE